MKKHPASARTQATHVVLLRGVNVGGHNRLPMADFIAALAHLGCAAVRTYIQSGNAVLTATPAIADRLAVNLQRHLHARLGLEVPVILRSTPELQRIVSANPLARPGAAAEHLHVGFLSTRPLAAAKKSLDPQRSPGDTFVVQGSEVYLHLPGGVAKTRLTNAWFDSQLGSTITVRNWHTVQKVLQMALAAA